MADGYIYLIHIREFIKTGESIFKIGRTEDPFKRIKQYPNGSKLILTVEVMDYQKVENELIHQFKLNFKQVKKIGSEYFEGDVNKMKTIIWDYCQHQIEQEKMKKNLLKDALLNEIERRKIPPAPNPPTVPKFYQNETINLYDNEDPFLSFFEYLFLKKDTQVDRFNADNLPDVDAKAKFGKKEVEGYNFVEIKQSELRKLFEIYCQKFLQQDKVMNDRSFGKAITSRTEIFLYCAKRKKAVGMMIYGFANNERLKKELVPTPLPPPTFEFPTSDVLEEYFYAHDDPKRMDCEYGEAVNIQVSVLRKFFKEKGFKFRGQTANLYKGKYFTNVIKNVVWAMGDEHWRREKYEKPKRDEGKNTQRVETVYLKKGTKLIDMLKNPPHP